MDLRVKIHLKMKGFADSKMQDDKGSLAYQALYRVWRPQQFIDVVGQEHVTKTLQNALLQQKISHAYLFSGPRGTGKTSAAKIFAKAVNCERCPSFRTL